MSPAAPAKYPRPIEETQSLGARGVGQSEENAPGRAIAPRRSCHSAVDLILPSWMTLEMIVPENTPFGKVTWRCSSVHALSYGTDGYDAYKIVKKPCAARAD